MSKLDQHNFILPGENVQTGDSEWETTSNLSKEALKNRWHTEAGKAKLERLRAARLDREELQKTVGMFNNHYDLRGIDLSGIDFSGRHLNDIDFYASNLSNCKFDGCNLDNSFLSECNIRGTTFDWANMEGVFLDSVDYDTKTSFHGVDLNRINFTLAALLHEQAISQQRIEHLKTRHPILSQLLFITSNYGQSIMRFLATCLVVIISFSIIYIVFYNMSINDSVRTSILSFLGISSPEGPAVYLSMLEAAIGYFLLALLAAIMVRKTMGS